MLLRNIFLIAFLGSIFAKAQPVKTAGMAKNVMQGIDLSPSVQLDTLFPQASLYGLGPVEDLQGEITVLAGSAYFAQVYGDTLLAGVDNSLRAPFFAYAHVAEFDSIALPVSLNGLKDLENCIDSVRASRNISDTTAFPFLLVAHNWNKLHFHIIMRDTSELQHSHEAHNKAKVPFEYSETSGILLGFFSKHHQGVFTHKGQFLHVHFVASDKHITGHLDSIQHTGTVWLLLPKQEP